MVKEETIKILAMLSAFYGQGKSDPEMMANAWHLVLSKYDYRIACKAILTFAENDKREYATFPAVGCIVDAIRNEEIQQNAPIRQIIRGVSYGRQYNTLSDNAKQIISEERYNGWLKMNAEEFAGKADKYAESLKTIQLRLQGGE